LGVHSVLRPDFPYSITVPLMKKLLLLLLLFLPLHSPAQSRLFVRANSDKVVVTGSSETLDLTNSYSAWVYLTGSPGASGYQVYSDTGGTSRVGIRIAYYDPGGAAYRFYCATQNGPEIWRQFAVTLTTATWYHLTVTVNTALLVGNNDVKFYVNGTQISEHSNSGANWVTNILNYSAGGIGCLTKDAGTSDEHWDGRIAQMARYKTALNQSQITALARGARFDRITPPEDLIQAWPVNGMSAEQDWGPLHLTSNSISGTTVVAGPPTVPR
jgi:hypothetical protein